MNDLFVAIYAIIIVIVPRHAITAQIPTWSMKWQVTSYQVTLTAGFTAGLPLAKPGSWVIVQGEIYNPFGNWLGTLQT